MCAQTWDIVMPATDVNDAPESFNNILLSVVNKFGPSKWIRGQERKSTWVTNDLLSLIDESTYRMGKFRKYPTEQNWLARQEANEVKKDLKMHYVIYALEKLILHIWRRS